MALNLKKKKNAQAATSHMHESIPLKKKMPCKLDSVSLNKSMGKVLHGSIHTNNVLLRLFSTEYDIL
jgi:hypothetical protein